MRLYATYTLGGAALLFAVTLPRRPVKAGTVGDQDLNFFLIWSGACVGAFLCALRSLRERGVIAEIIRWAVSGAATGTLIATTEIRAYASVMPAWQVLGLGAGIGAAFGILLCWVARHLELSV